LKHKEFIDLATSLRHEYTYLADEEEVNHAEEMEKVFNTQCFEEVSRPVDSSAQ